MHSSLQILWEEERKTLNQEQKQSFVDLGCGNGLLVYILSEEGVIGNYYIILNTAGFLIFVAIIHVPIKAC